MDNPPAPSTNNQANPQPAAEVLHPRADDTSAELPNPPTDPGGDPSKKVRHRYRPSHRATFIGLAVVIAILAVNATVLIFVLKRQSKLNDQAANGQVTVSQDVLNKLGVNRTPVNQTGVGLTIGPSTQFKNKVSVAGDVNIAGQLQLNSKLSAGDASLAQLQAGKTSLNQLDVNGDTTVSNLNLRNDLLVAGSTRLQGAVTISKLLSVNNDISVTGNLSIGGTFSVRSFTSTSTFTVGGHLVTAGSAPAYSPGSAVGSNGTVSLSGNDASGTIAINVGVGASAGTLISVTFINAYATTPHVIITPIGIGVTGYYVNRSATGFSIGISSGLPPAGYAFDYIVEQ